MKIASLLAALVAVMVLAGTASAAPAVPSMCGVIPAGGKKWYVTIDGASCATAKRILAKIARKAKGVNVTVNLGKQAGMTCKYVSFSGNSGIDCYHGSKTMRAALYRG